MTSYPPNGWADEPRLVVERHGHQVVVDGQGLAIDGERICRTPLRPEHAVKPSEDPHRSRAFQVTGGGEVVYRGRVVAELAPPPPGTSNPGELTVHGPNGREWPASPAERVSPAAERPGRAAERTPDPAPALPSAAELQTSVDDAQASVDQLVRRQRDEQEVRARETPQPSHQPPSKTREMELTR
ncbi:hypothetical protein [Streptomyces sp. XY431]|uniref:hypothetical protein n=1 Tax=Streptomyces sp. XY431 TaxID=1415562 RepID=UPI0006AE5962|nr:hypothetical protein [Streptomyces sp. XY431]